MSLRAVLILAVLGLGGYLVVTSSWFLTRQVRPALEAQLGGTVRIGSTHYAGDGRLILQNITVTAPGMSGPAARVASIGMAEVLLDVDTIYGGNPAVREVDLHDVILRISEDAQQNGVFNFMGFRSRLKGADPAVLPMRVAIHRAVVEVGEHDGAAYTMHGSREAAGHLFAVDADAGWYSVQLFELLGRSEAQGRLLARGRWNALTLAYEATVGDLLLDDRAMAMCPPSARVWWEELDPEGRVAEASISWNVQRGLEVVVALDEVGLTLPIEGDSLWGRLRHGQVEPSTGRPRMLVHSGRLRLHGNTFELERLQGELIGSESSDAGQLVAVPYNVVLKIEAPEEIEWNNRYAWLEEVLEIAPFTMHVRLDDFSLEQRDEDPRAVELPLAVARVLERFNMTGWSLRTQIDVTRDAPHMSADNTWIAGETHTHGRAIIANAYGRYERFPYQLDQMEANLEFTDDSVTIHYLRGQGSGDGVIEISGIIAPLTLDNGVELELVANDLPLDDRLRSALGDSQQEVFDLLLHQPSHNALATAGLLPIADDVVTLQTARQELVNRLVEERQSVDAIPADQLVPGDRRLRQIERQLEAGAFELGGEVDLDLRIFRVVGDDGAPFVTGTVTVQDVGIIYEGFPYPVTAKEGVIDWGIDGLVVRDQDDSGGIPFITPGGGEGRLGGSIDIIREDGDVRLHPNLSIIAVEDQLNPLLLAAIPVDADRFNDDDSHTNRLPDWPGVTRSAAADFLDEVGADATVTCMGRITADTSGDLTYNFQVDLNDVTARPKAALVELLETPGAVWPTDFAIESGAGTLDVSPGHVQLKAFSASHQTGTVTASGVFDQDEQGRSRTHLDVTFNDVSIGEYMLNLAPDAWRTHAERLWSQYTPSGVITADLMYKKVTGGEQAIDLKAHSASLHALLDDQPVQFRQVEGALEFGTSQDEGRTLVFDVESGNRADGRLTLAMPPAGTHERLLDVTWHSGAFESPLVIEGLRLAGWDTAVDTYRAHQPFGAFDATFGLVAGQDGSPAPDTVTLRPDSLGLQLKGTPVLLQFAEGVEIDLGRDGFVLDDIRGEFGNGSFLVNGRIDTGDQFHADLALTIDGPLRSPELLAILPEQVENVLETIAFRDGPRTTIQVGSLRLDHVAGATEGTPWAAQVRAAIVTDGAAFDAGVVFDDIAGTIAVSADYQPGMVPNIAIELKADHATAEQFDLTNVHASVRVSRSRNIVEVREFAADVYGGAVVGTAWSSISDNTYGVELDIVGSQVTAFFEGLMERADKPHKQSDPPAGVIYASLGLTGLRGDAESRSGRGHLRIVDGRLARVLAGLKVLQLLQLTVQFVDSFNFASLDFYADGDRIVFENILLEAGLGDIAQLQLQQIDEGEMDFNTYELNTRFVPRSGWRGLRELAGSVSDQLYIIEVTGTLANPNVRVIPLPGLAPARSKSMSVGVAN